MNLGWSRTSLLALTRELSAKWHQTREQWRDDKAVEFERKYLEELIATVNTTATNIDRLDRIISKLKKDCE
jgi:hypothetical protein